jgi:cysteine desulfurase
MSSTPLIYLDHAATAPIDARVAAAMQDCIGLHHSANASSTHAAGREVRRQIDAAAATVAARIGAAPEDLVFTSGATEANQLALLGAADGRRGHLVTTQIEHASVLEHVKLLAGRGWRITRLTCDQRGYVEPARLAAALTDETLLVSIMHVNNEIGVVQEIEELGACCRARGIAMHVDAAQSIGKVDVNVRRWGADLVSLSAHKAHGPKGVGALYVRPGMRIVPQLLGGEHQRGLRAGTLPTHQIVGMAQAYELADPRTDGPVLRQRSQQLRAALATIPGVRFNGDPQISAPHIVSATFPGVDGESLRFALADLAVSAGSACRSDAAEPSHVLSALGLSDALAGATLRFSLGRDTTAAELARGAQRVAAEVARLRALACGAPRWCSA